MEKFWPGVHNRCLHHVDELDHRTLLIAHIAITTNADEVESFSPHGRLKWFHKIQCDRTKLDAANQPESPPADVATGQQGSLVQEKFSFSEPLATRLEKSPSLEPGPTSTNSNARGPVLDSVSNARL
jgi:hypothetical protein